MTKILKLKKLNDYNEINQLLSKGEVISFPTETVYGIGGDLFNINSVYNIFKIKNRSIAKPLSAHISDINMVENLSDNVPDIFYKLAERFLPGPLAIIIPKSDKISSLVTGGLNTIGIRFPDNEIFQKICNDLGKPIAATSANESGKSNKITSEEVYDELKDKIPLIIDSGETKFKQPSTVISVVNGIKVFREGALKKEILEEFLKMNLK